MWGKDSGDIVHMGRERGDEWGREKRGRDEYTIHPANANKSEGAAVFKTTHFRQFQAQPR